MTLNTFAVCRMCVRETRVMISLFGEDALWKKLKAIANIEIFEGDDLPQQICMGCERDTIKAYSVKSKCEKADFILRKAVSDSNFNLRSVDVVALMNEVPQIANVLNSGSSVFPTNENGLPIGIKQEIVDPTEENEKKQTFGNKSQPVARAETDTTSAWTTIGASTSADCVAGNINIQTENSNNQQMVENESFAQYLNEPEGAEGNSMYECTVCKKFYKRKFFFDKHISTGMCGKRTETPKCMDCNEVFPTNHHLGSHRRYKHCANVTLNQESQEGPVTEDKKTIEHNYFIPLKKRRMRRRRKRLLYTRRKREKPSKEMLNPSIEFGKKGDNESMSEEDGEGDMDDDEEAMGEDANCPSPINEEDLKGLERLMELEKNESVGAQTPNDKMDFERQVYDGAAESENNTENMDVTDLQTSKDVNDSLPTNETFLNESVKSKNRKPRTIIDASKYEEAKKLIHEYTTIQDFAKRLDVSIPTGYRLKRKAELELSQNEDELESCLSAEESQVEQKLEDCNDNLRLNKSVRKRKYIDRQTYEKALQLLQSDVSMKLWPAELGICLSTAFYLRRKIRNNEPFYFKASGQDRPKQKRKYINEETYKKALELTSADVPVKDWPPQLGICRSTASYLRRKIRLGEPFTFRKHATKRIQEDLRNENDEPLRG